MSRLFISYSHSQQAEALALHQWLTANGWDDVFIDVNPNPSKALVPGQDIDDQIRKRIVWADAVIAFISHEWLRSPACQAEERIARDLGKPIFGLLREQDLLRGNILPDHLRKTWLVSANEGQQYQEFRIAPDNTEERTVRLSTLALRRLSSGLSAGGYSPGSFKWPPVSDPMRSPFRGLSPLNAEDAGIFFGREAEMVTALTEIRRLADSDGPRFLAILGASGAGKSSFLRAGLLPRLARDDRHFFVLPPIRPERNALSGDLGLVRALAASFEACGFPLDAEQIAKAVAHGVSGLHNLLARLNEQSAAPVTADDLRQATTVDRRIIVVPIDQGEELFTSDGRDEANQFMALLNGLLQSPDQPVLAIMTIRSDAFERLQSAPELATTPPLAFSLPPLQRGAYRMVIEGPAALLRDTGRAFELEPILSATLLQDIDSGSSKDALPLLAFTLERLFRAHGADKILTLEKYRQMGGIRGSIEAAVEAVLDQAKAQDPALYDRDRQLSVLRRAFIPWLAGIDPDTRSPRRLVARRYDLAEAAPLIDLLIEQRLLSTDISPEHGEATVEPAHEALLRQWDLLRAWLEEDEAILATLETLQRAAKDWRINGGDESWLVHQGVRLEDAERLADRADLAVKLSSVERTYLNAARAVEAERRDRELAEARRFAEAQRLTVEAERRSLRNTRIAAGIAIGLATIASSAGFLVWQQRNTSIVQVEKISALQEETAARLTHDKISESRILAGDAIERMRNGFLPEASAMLLYALPENDASAQSIRPMVPEALQALYTDWNLDTVTLYFQHGTDIDFSSAVMTTDGTRILTSAADRTARLWDAKTGASIGNAMPHDNDDMGPALSPDGTRFVTTVGTTAQLWDSTTGTAIGKPIVHDKAISDMAFSADSLRMVTVSHDQTARLWNARTGTAIGTPMQHDDAVTSVLFSPDGTRILTVSQDNKAQLWNAETTTAIGKPMLHGDLINRTAFSPDGTRLATASDDQTMHIWNAITGEPIGAPLQNDAVIIKLVFSPDGKRLATGDTAGIVRLWQADPISEIGTMSGSGLNDIQFSADGSLLLASWSEGIARQLDTESGKPAGLPMQHGEEINDAAFSPDGTKIVTSSADKTARIWESRTGQPIGQPLRHESAVTKASFSPDGSLILTREAHGSLRVWDSQTGLMVGAPVRDKNIEAVSFVDGGKQLLTASSDGVARLRDIRRHRREGPVVTNRDAVSNASFVGAAGIMTGSRNGDIILWDAATSEQIGAPISAAEALQAKVYLSPDEKRLLTISTTGMAWLWDVDTIHGAKSTLQLTAKEPVKSARFSPDGARLLTISAEGTTRLWDTKTAETIGQPMQTIADLSPRFSPDGHRLVTTSEQDRLQLWDAMTGEPIGQPMEHLSSVGAVGFSPDGNWIVSTSRDGDIRIWDARTAMPVGDPIQSEGEASAVFFLPDNKQILATYSDNTIRIWDATTHQETVTTKIQADAQFTAFSPDFTKIVTVSDDTTGQIWDVRSGAPIGKPIVHTDKLNAAVFSPDGTRLATASADNTIRLWDPDTGVAMSEPMLHQDAVSSIEFSRDGQKLVSTSSDHTARSWNVDIPSSRIIIPVMRAQEYDDIPDETREDLHLPKRSQNFPALETNGCGPSTPTPSTLPANDVAVEANSRDKEATIVTCRQALEKSPSDPRLHYLLGQALSTSGQYQEAFAELQNAAVDGYPIALQALAAAWQSGSGIPENGAKARLLYGEALKQGVFTSGKPLGEMVWKGDGGPVDKAEAMAIWAAAADAGDASSHERLAWVYEAGRNGTPPDLAKALYHYIIAVKLADDGGDGKSGRIAQSRRASLARILPAEIVAAEWQKASEFNADHGAALQKLLKSNVK